jgi:cytochrome b561
MRFAWEREKSANYVPVKQSFASRLIYIAYNVVYFIPIVLPFVGTIDYRTGYVAFFVFIIIRAAANVYRNNVLTLEQAEAFPLRSP